MKQTTFAEGGFERYAKTTKRAVFLSEMNQVVPWSMLCELIEPHYPKAGNGRPPVGVERMLRIYFLQQWFNLSDPAVEEALYESVSMRSFANIDLGNEPVPDETTVCKFRRLLERHGLGKRIFEEVGRHLQERGMRVSGGTIVDATIISAPSSTKNKEGKRDPEMRQTKKGNQWYFGMKGHIGVDSKTKLIHTVVATGANVPGIKDFTNIRGTRSHTLTEEERLTNRRKSGVRAKVEHAFCIIKRLFGFAKVRYRGMQKNAHRLFVTCALANLFMARRRLMRMQGA